MASTSPSLAGDAGRKADFVNYADGFANRFRTLPGGRGLLLGSLAGIVAATIAAPFSTGALPPLQRLVFWTSTVSMVGLLWRSWFAWRVRTSDDWLRAVWTGLIVITLVMPLVISAGLALVGQRLGPGWTRIWLESGAIGLAILVALMFVERRRHLHAPPAKGRLFRMGVTDPVHLRRVTSDDHYLRLHLADGRVLMVHGRFADIASELAPLDGVVARRGRWIAAADLAAIERDGKRLVLVARDGERIAVSASGRSDMKARGWTA